MWLSFLCTYTMTIYSVTSFMWLLALSVLTCCPNISFLARLVSDNFRGLEKFELGALSPQAPPRKIFLDGVWELVHSYLRVRLNFPSSINFRYICAKLHPKPYLAPFPRYSLRHAYIFGYPSYVLLRVFYELDKRPITGFMLDFWTYSLRTQADSSLDNTSQKAYLNSNFSRTLEKWLKKDSIP